MGVRADGTEELIAMSDGYRESADSWADLLRDRIRAVFTGLTAASGGVCCPLDTESDTFHMCRLNGQPIQATVPSPCFANYCDPEAVRPGHPHSWGSRGRRYKSCRPDF